MTGSQLAVAVQAGPRREVQLAVAVRGEQRIRTQLTQLTIPVVQGLQGYQHSLQMDMVCDYKRWRTSPPRHHSYATCTTYTGAFRNAHKHSVCDVITNHK